MTSGTQGRSFRPMLFDGLKRTPLPDDPARGQEALEPLPGLSGRAADLIVGTAGSSPFLAGLLRREAEWLDGQIEATPEQALQGILERAAKAEGDPAGLLRTEKRRLALLVGLLDLGGAWDLDQVTGALTDFADTALQRAMVEAVRAEARRRKLGALNPDEVGPEAAGLVALAMGKMGARELNYSSDIDLILLIDDEIWPGDAFAEARPAFLKATRRAMATLSEITGEGYVFRTDLRLRPDASVTPVAIGMAAAEEYYESVGRTWERAAFIKARAAAGDI
ncbi:MAG: glutamine-synthetase adenylyltransferase, partial [Pseudomonadota bacterium]